MSVSNNNTIRELTLCPICKSSNLEVVYDEAADHITKKQFSILGCKSCALRFTYPVPENPNHFYPKKYRIYGPIVLRILRALYLIRARRLTSLFSKPKAALEIGCGDGFMLNSLKSMGWEVTGIERTEEVASHARDVFGINVVSKGIEHLPKKPTFDLIFFFNSLEHMADPLSMVKECTFRLKPNGKLIIMVPNFDSWQSRFAGAKWVHLDPPRHLCHFNQESISNMFKSVGFTVSDINFVSLEHDPYGWIQSSINKITNRDNTLTRYLMGLEKFDFQIFLSVIISTILFLPSIILAVVSWFFSQGALMQVIATNQAADKSG